MDLLDVVHVFILGIQPDLGLPPVRVGRARRRQLVFLAQLVEMVKGGLVAGVKERSDDQRG